MFSLAYLCVTTPRFQVMPNLKILIWYEIYKLLYITVSLTDIFLCIQSEQPGTKTKRVCEIACSKDSSRFAYLWVMSSLREASPSLRALWVIIVISAQPVIHQHAPHKTHHYKGPRQEMRWGRAPGAALSNHNGQLSPTASTRLPQL